ncbi:lysine-2,3-aminomutase-like protein [Siculibacillus lacustris]|uniref:Lysine-2,3-aminomutase-like protein n=1 Tax=Siculibacillus lacustris TaxID=1549641 RepID=A0A4Q9VMV4_9HYPH|nr:lysine-2,3-aminomutase-like protein [Siculibacillus lacustris]TBW36962.1 lysine-2,3-aminomutase-like protein [Siculibacillus lacustris]
MSRRDDLRRPEELVAAGLIDPTRLTEIARVAERFALAITAPVLDLIDPDDPNDPIARQFVPSEEELAAATDEVADPIGDGPYTVMPGLTHRYPDRVLLKPTHLCRVYCRFCFRRETVGHGETTLSEAEIDAAIAHVAARPEIFEVILTGGDPLVLSDRRLAAILDRLEAVPHVEVVRFHSRVPVVDPERITPETARSMRRRFATWMVIHVDHPRELTPGAAAAIGRLVDAGVPVLAQTTLLAGVNDDAAVLEALFRRLVALRVKPYYLHHLDRAEGTARFRTPVAAGQALMHALRGRLTGIAQPTYVLDIPGGAGKVPIGPTWIVPEPADPAADPAVAAPEGAPRRWCVEDPAGRHHDYED